MKKTLFIPVAFLLLITTTVHADRLVLGVLQTGDRAVTVDTVTFIWGTVPDQMFWPEAWGGPPGTTDSTVFAITGPSFPPNARLRYWVGGTMMPPDTIIGIRPDSWYVLRTQYDTDTRVKFLDVPGVEESAQPTAHSLQVAVFPNPTSDFATVRLSPSSFIPHHSSFSLFDASGRLVLNSSLVTRNSSLQLDLRGLSAGVYLVRLTTPSGTLTDRLTLVR